MTLDELRALATGTRDGIACWEGDLGAMAVTLPEAEFLHALVVMVRPEAVLELGTGMGISGRFIAEGLVGTDGVLTTVERDAKYRTLARATLEDVPALVVSAEPDGPFDLVYIDSVVNHRAADIERWMVRRPKDTLVVVHDAARDYEGLRLGVGVLMPSQAGFWIGRGT